MSQPPTVLHWVRMSALRIHDNPALQRALMETQHRLRCVFIIDPWFVRGRIEENRCEVASLQQIFIPSCVSPCWLYIQVSIPAGESS